MAWLEEWRALAGRIEGLVRAGEFLMSAMTVHRSDVYSVVRKSFKPELKAITEELNLFRQTYGSDLPPKSFEALQQYLAKNWSDAMGQSGSSGAAHEVQVLAPLAAFRSEFEYLIRDSEIEGRSLTELAFEHLRRQIVVDEDVRKKWIKAFDKHETACEALGAVHLLSHGIWAFKVLGPGAATDLVYGDPVTEHITIARKVARALVLTEWKVVKQANEIDAKAKEGRHQAALYAAGILGDLELKRTRYIVLVCGSELHPLDDVEDRGVTYRHVIVPTKPKPPSQAARSRPAFSV